MINWTSADTRLDEHTRFVAKVNREAWKWSSGGRVDRTSAGARLIALARRLAIRPGASRPRPLAPRLAAR